ncbi:IS21 family transposase [Sinorhizobium medicae]
MILDLHRQGLSVSAIARQTGADRKTVRKYIERGLEAPAYGPRRPRATVIDPFAAYLRERVAVYPGLTARRLLRELKERGYSGGYTAVTDFLRDIRPPGEHGFEVRFETPPGEQAQVDFAQFHVVFTDEPTTPRIVWLFSMVLGYSRLIWARFVMHQNLLTVLRCHVAAFDAIGGVPREILYDRMKTAVIGEGETDGISIIALLSTWPVITAFTPRPAGPIGPKRKARSRDHSATYVKTSSWLARSAISRT